MFEVPKEEIFWDAQRMKSQKQFQLERNNWPA